MSPEPVSYTHLDVYKRQSVDSPDSEASGEGEEAVSGMSDEEENISAEPAEGITVRESDYGYSLRYDADRYEYRRVEGYDDYSLKTYEGDKPSVYLCVSAIGAEYFDDVKKSLMTGNVSLSLIHILHTIPAAMPELR